MLQENINLIPGGLSYYGRPPVLRLGFATQFCSSALQLSFAAIRPCGQDTCRKESVALTGGYVRIALTEYKIEKREHKDHEDIDYRR